MRPQNMYGATMSTIIRFEWLQNGLSKKEPTTANALGTVLYVLGFVGFVCCTMIFGCYSLTLSSSRSCGVNSWIWRFVPSSSSPMGWKQGFSKFCFSMQSNARCNTCRSLICALFDSTCSCHQLYMWWTREANKHHAIFQGTCWVAIKLSPSKQSSPPAMWVQCFPKVTYAMRTNSIICPMQRQLP